MGREKFNRKMEQWIGGIQSSFFLMERKGKLRENEKRRRIGEALEIWGEHFEKGLEKKKRGQKKKELNIQSRTYSTRKRSEGRREGTAKW